MIACTKTTTQLLDALHDLSDGDAWREFDERHRPILFGVARRLGLDQEDAADVAQQTLTEFIRAYQQGQYDRERGRLRSWIIGIARHRSLDALRRRARVAGTRGESGYLDLPAEDRWGEIWSAERDQVILRRALDELRVRSKMTDATLSIFEKVALRAEPAERVAHEFEISVDEVYRIKHRVTTKLKDITARLRALYDEDD